MFRDVGFTNAQLMDVPTGYPPIYGEIPGPEGSPVVMLYAHYDVQPAPPEQGWTTDPWTPTRKDDGRIYGRGAADDKGGLVTHLGTLRSSMASHHARSGSSWRGWRRPRATSNPSSTPIPSSSTATCSSSATWATSAWASRP